MVIQVVVTKENILTLPKTFSRDRLRRFEALEKVSCKTKEACEAAKQEAKQLLVGVLGSMSNTQKRLDRKDRLRDVVPN